MPRTLRKFTRFGSIAATLAVLGLSGYQAGRVTGSDNVANVSPLAAAESTPLPPPSVTPPAAIPTRDTRPPSGPTPTLVPTESPVDVNRRVIGGIPASRKRQLTIDVVAVRSDGLPHKPVRYVVIFHLPTTSQITLDASGNEVHRSIKDPAAKTALEEVLSNAALKATALELTR